MAFCDFETILCLAFVGIGGFVLGAMIVILWALCAADKKREKDEEL